MTSPSLPASSAALAFGNSRIARCGALLLRGCHRWRPDLAARLAVDLFFTPLPTKLESRKRIPPRWQARVQRGADESFVLLRRPATAGRSLPAPPRVLLVHGWAGGAWQMLPLAQTLDAAGFETVLMDLPAHGRSAGWRCTIPQIVRSLVAAQAAAGPFDAIVAHSMGALASLHAMAHGMPVPRLVALAPSATPQTVLHWFGDALCLPPGMVARIRERIVAHEGMALEQFEPAWLGARVAAPVLLVHDRGDRMASFAQSEALVRALPGACLYATEGLSHRRILDDPSVVEWVLRQLALPVHAASGR
jgi:pimeloyl-ACP methyl ester carboxylesterase